MEAFAGRGIAESLNASLMLTASLHPPLSATPSGAVALAAGVSYRWDVLRAVPYVGAGVGAYALHGVNPQLKSARFGGPLRLGVDYLLSRDVVLSGQATAHVVSADGDVQIPWFQVGIGVSHSWGF